MKSFQYKKNCNFSLSDDLSGRGRHGGKKGAQSEVAYGSQGRPRSARGVLQRKSYDNDVTCQHCVKVKDKLD